MTAGNQHRLKEKPKHQVRGDDVEMGGETQIRPGREAEHEGEAGSRVVVRQLAEKSVKEGWEHRGQAEGEQFLGKKVNAIVPQVGETPRKKPDWRRSLESGSEDDRPIAETKEGENVKKNLATSEPQEAEQPEGEEGSEDEKNIENEESSDADVGSDAEDGNDTEEGSKAAAESEEGTKEAKERRKKGGSDGWMLEPRLREPRAPGEAPNLAEGNERGEGALRGRESLPDLKSQQDSGNGSNPNKDGGKKNANSKQSKPQRERVTEGEEGEGGKWPSKVGYTDPPRKPRTARWNAEAADKPYYQDASIWEKQAWEGAPPSYYNNSKLGKWGGGLYQLREGPH